MQNRCLFFLFILFLGMTTLHAQPNPPNIEDLLNLQEIRGVKISPNGQWIAYGVRQADLEEDAYLNQIWIVGVDGGDPYALTRGKKSANNFRWSPDSRWLAFTSSRHEDKNQIFAIRPTGGEAVRLTDAKNVSDYAWSKDGKRLAFKATDPDPKQSEKRKNYMGGYEVVRREYRHAHLWVVDFEEALKHPASGTRLTSGEDYHVGDFAWSPDGSQIAFSATINPDYIHWGTEDIYIYAFADSATRKIVDQPGPDSTPRWSPDGSRIVFSSVMGEKHFYATNNELAVIPAEGGKPVCISESFDEDARLIDWMDDGIVFTALQKTSRHLFRIDPETHKIKRLTQPDDFILGSASFTADGKTLALTASSPESVSEVYTTSIKRFKPKKRTNMNAQMENFKLGSREVIAWQSRDSATIEGVLIKPADFDPFVKRPLLCIIHGGPTGIDMPVFRENRYYPADIWTGRGALILKVNYRGSAGYGEAFRNLNMNNLGVGDAWDVLSGVEHLIDKGWVDPERIGCMGWSQGGYISAFLTASSDQFAAISVGAGISNWATYYYNTDITPFTINYLGDDPADDPAIYKITSPMSYIQDAQTPTLIQHGEFDRRVPIPNAYELRQGLVDRGVPVEMVVYKGYGHGISKPKSQRAVMWHNLVWFNHYIWGDPLPDLAQPDIPEDKETEEEIEE